MVRRARPTCAGALLAPLGALYGWIAEARYRRRQPYRSRLPVICVGNFTAGGTGKTPLSHLHRRACCIARGERPVFLTRGYGGTHAGPAWVEDAAGRRATLRRRAAAARRASRRRSSPATARRGVDRHRERAAARPSVVIMDDGLQNPALAKDLSIAVVDGERGLGNGEVIPAGPLRAPLDFQLGLVDAIVVREPAEDAAAAAQRARAACGAAFPARCWPRASAPAAIPPGSPRARSSPSPASPIRSASLRLLEQPRRASSSSASRSPTTTPSRARTPSACSRWREAKARELVTTEKDWARLDGRCGARGELAARRAPLPSSMAFEERDLGRLVLADRRGDAGTPAAIRAA